jgi:hypothetical protein
MAFQVQTASAMPSARFPITGLYRVQVSGWDKNEAFFVEKSEMEWNEGSGKRVKLSNAVPDGAVIFLRWLQSLSAAPAQPVPYEAEFLAVDPKRPTAIPATPSHCGSWSARRQ